MSRGASLDPGRNWWSRRWLEVLDEQGAGLARAVQRGQALARRAGVERLRIEPGRAGARVLDEEQARDVALHWPVPDEDAWQRAVAVLSAELRFTAALLEGDLPEEAEAPLAAVGLPLVPDLAEVELTCPCAERPRPCRHEVALWTALAAALDRDVFALLRLRGRDRERLLVALRRARGAEEPEPQGAGLDLSLGLYAAHGDLDAIELRPAPAVDAAARLRQLGPPPGVDDARPLEDLVERAAATAWRLAAGEGTQAADEELLLAELRAQRVATAGSLADALGRDAAAVRGELDRLFAEGTVLRMGSGESAKYRAASA